MRSMRLHLGDVTVKFTYGTYTARGFGKRVSCTRGARPAIEALLTKASVSLHGLVIGPVQPMRQGHSRYPIYREDEI